VIVNSTSGIAALTPAIVAPTQGVALLTDLPLDMTLPTPSAGTTDATEIGCNVVPSPAPTARREISTADVSGGARLHYSHRPPLHHQVRKRRFLIDKGSDLCVYPRKLTPQRRTSVNYDLRAANGTTISTYRWLPLSLNLGSRRGHQLCGCLLSYRRRHPTDQSKGSVTRRHLSQSMLSFTLREIRLADFGWTWC
jgi:hypothetical protein